MSAFNKQIAKYREALLALEQKMQADYDKAVMTLSGGALGVSFAFLKDVLGHRELVSPIWLLAAWICWGLSVTCTLGSFWTSALALRKAVRQTDEREIYIQQPGGKFDWITTVLNAAAGLLFFAGVVSIVL